VVSLRGARACAALLALALVAAGCDKFSARVEFKKGNSAYKNEEYREAIAAYQRGLALDPEAKAVWRSLGLAAMALYRPGDTSADNAQYAKQAIDAFQNYLQEFPKDEKVEDYLLTTLINAGKYDDALAKLQAEKALNPGDSKLDEGIISVLVKAKRVDEAAKRMEDLGPRATYQMYYAVGVALWDDVYHNPTPDLAKRTEEVDTGLAALRHAVTMKPDSFDANVYVNLMIREKAKLETDTTKQQALYAEAEKYRQKETEIAAKSKKPS